MINMEKESVFLFNLVHTVRQKLKTNNCTYKYIILITELEYLISKLYFLIRTYLKKYVI